MPLNSGVYHRAIGAIHSGHISHDDGEAPVRGESSSLLHRPENKGTENEWGYPILTASGKVSVKHVGSALGFAEKNGESEIVPALHKISDLIHGRDDSTKAMSRAFELVGQLSERLAAIPDVEVDSLDLSRSPRLAKCPTCGSHDVTRLAAATEDEGPMDSCPHCDKTWPHKPGTITPQQYTGQQPAEEDEVAIEELPRNELQAESLQQGLDSGQSTTFGFPNLVSSTARGYFGTA